MNPNDNSAAGGGAGGSGTTTGPAQLGYSVSRQAAEAPKPAEAQISKPAQEGPRATFAALQPPKMSLPLGGGAMRSIGETFKANPATGTLSASIPIPVSPLPRGPVPQLALSYDSGSGNGLFGIGWSLGTMQIARRTDRKLPEYLDREDSDEFLFGGEALVPVFDGATRYQRTESLGGETYLVERYQPRTEGAFTRVERWTRTSGSDLPDIHWQVRTADNTVSKLGLSSSSRLTAPDWSYRVFSWFVDETRDDRGNVMTYEYVAEDLVNVSKAIPSEAHRTGPQAQRHLKRIRYGNRDMGDEATCQVEVVFDYGDHDASVPTPTPSQAWPVRQDPFSSYRSGFELRTYRLCRRVLVFHRFSGSPVLVRALSLTHDETPKVSQLTSAQVVGYQSNGSGGYTSESMPPVTFSYSQAPWERKIRFLQPGDISDFSPIAMTKSVQWVDLDGEGLPGVLSDRGTAITYKPNRGEARLCAARKLPTAPNMRMASSGGGAQLMNVEGSGAMSMVRLDPVAPGFQQRTKDGWGPFRPFPKVPNVDWRSPSLRMTDLSGDGFDDILITRGDHFVWHPSLGKDGWGPANRVPIPSDPKLGPRVVFAGRFNAVFLADMTGDVLSDIVRIEHRRVTYWPNLGRGRFGKQIVMPIVIDTRESFHPGLVRLADLDGTGTAHLMYFDSRGTHVFQNQAGNSFAAPLHNEMMRWPSIHTLSIVDLLGTGMPALVHHYNRSRPPDVRYLMPFGSKKPYLLERMDNGMGLEVAFEYESSTKSYHADKAAKRPWATKLPFPVQVLSRVESYDHIAKRRFATSYSYHHGYYDLIEREFRGFGMVESLDAESFDEASGKGVFGDLPIENDELQQPPVLTRTWFHTGAWTEQPSLEAAYASERFNGDTAAPAPIACSIPTGLPVDETREAHRALRGSMLRSETYLASDLEGPGASSHVPYAVSESSYEVVRRQARMPSGVSTALQGKRDKLHAVFQLLPTETRALSYDRVASDPRVTQWIALDYDVDYGFVLKDLSVAYRRRAAARTAAETAEGVTLTEQSRTLASASETMLAHVDNLDDAYRLAVPVESAQYELTGLDAETPLTRAAHDDAAGLSPRGLRADRPAPRPAPPRQPRRTARAPAHRSAAAPDSPACRAPDRGAHQPAPGPRGSHHRPRPQAARSAHRSQR